MAELNPTNNKFSELGRLRSELKTCETNIYLKGIYHDINTNWRPKRNDAIHQAAKISIALSKVWQDFMDLANETAEEGMVIFRKLDNEIKKERR